MRSRWLMLALALLIASPALAARDGDDIVAPVDGGDAMMGHDGSKFRAVKVDEDGVVWMTDKKAARYQTGRIALATNLAIVDEQHAFKPSGTSFAAYMNGRLIIRGSVNNTASGASVDHVLCWLWSSNDNVNFAPIWSSDGGSTPIRVQGRATSPPGEDEDYEWTITFDVDQFYGDYVMPYFAVDSTVAGTRTINADAEYREE